MATDSSSFDVVLSDDFSNGYKVENWGYAFNGGTYWNGAFTWSNSDVAVRDGTMQVTQTRHSDGSWTTGGFNSFKADKTITYGKIEFDGKVEESQGTMGVFLTWPKSDSWPIDGEIDILETPGQDVMHTDALGGQQRQPPVQLRPQPELRRDAVEPLRAAVAAGLHEHPGERQPRRRVDRP
jgi:hypothetical protein